VSELFDTIKKEIKRSGYDGMLRAGAVITGGCAQLPGLKEVAARELGFPVRIARPEKLTGMADALRHPSYSTSVGLLRMGLNMDTGSSSSSSISRGPTPAPKIGAIVGNLFRRLLPDNEG
jgi:cell division protein FtsA